MMRFESTQFNGPKIRPVARTVKAAKDFIEAELAKYGTWEEFRDSARGGPIQDVIESEPSYRSIKGQGVGISAIHAFLGKQWSRYLIENSLSVIRQEEAADRKRAEAYEARQDDGTILRCPPHGDAAILRSQFHTCLLLKFEEQSPAWNCPINPLPQKRGSPPGHW